MDLWVEGIVLSSFPYGEKDLILKVFCKNDGLISVIAKNAQGSKKRFPALADIFNKVRLNLKEKTGSNLYAVKSAEVLEQYKLLRRDYLGFLWASVLAEISSFLALGERKDNCFEILEEAFIKGPGQEGAYWQNQIALFLSHLGYWPDYNCSVCGSQHYFWKAAHFMARTCFYCKEKEFKGWINNYFNFLKLLELSVGEICQKNLKTLPILREYYQEI